MSRIQPRDKSVSESCNYVHRILNAVEQRQYVTWQRRLLNDLGFATTFFATYALCVLIAHILGWSV